MWRATTKLRCMCRLQTGATHGCGYCSKPTGTKPAADKGTAPPLPGTAPPLPDQPMEFGRSAPPPPGGGGASAFFKLFGLTMVGGGGLVGYAWYDPEFRKQLEDNIPGARIAMTPVMEYFPPPGGVPTRPAPDMKAREVQDAVKTEDVSARKSVQADLDSKMNHFTDHSSKAVGGKSEQVAKVQRIIHEKEAEVAAENAAMESILVDLLGETSESAQVGMDALNCAASAIRSHVNQLREAMDSEAEGKAKSEQWREVSVAHEEKVQAEHKVESVVTDAKEALEKLHQAIKDGRANRLTRKNKTLLEMEEAYSQISYEVKNAEANLDRARSESCVMEDYRDLVKKGREQFRKELESVKPEVRIGRRVGGRMTEEELNMLIAHAHRRVEQLQCQLAEQQSMEAMRVLKAVRSQQLEDMRLADNRVGREITHLKAQFELEKRRMEDQIEVDTEQAIRTQLARQAAAHSDHLTQVISVQKDALEKKYQQLLHDQVLAERDAIREEIAGWVARLHGIESAVEARAESEKLGRKAQELWLACQTFVTVIEHGRDGATSWEDAKKPLENEVKAIRLAGNEHPFVNTIVQALPEEVLSNGVMTKDGLVDRFDKVQRLCRRVAMVDETGTSLYRYLLSYMQSLLVLTPRPLTEQDVVDPDQLDTFTIVTSARHSLERGDLEQAVRYVNQLTGEPRLVAADWLREARLLLDTKQAADALFAHASCTGLGSLF